MPAIPRATQWLWAAVTVDSGRLEDQKLSLPLGKTVPCSQKNEELCGYFSIWDSGSVCNTPKHALVTLQWSNFNYPVCTYAAFSLLNPVCCAQEEQRVSLRADPAPGGSPPCCVMAQSNTLTPCASSTPEHMAEQSREESQCFFYGSYRWDQGNQHNWRRLWRMIPFACALPSVRSMIPLALTRSLVLHSYLSPSLVHLTPHFWLISWPSGPAYFFRAVWGVQFELDGQGFPPGNATQNSHKGTLDIAKAETSSE